jgi:hypothetical protein
LHDIELLPNIGGMNDILDDERRRTGWGQTMKRAVKVMKTEGTVHIKSFLDLSLDEEGLANELVLDNASVFPTPYSLDISRNRGCWYLCIVTQQTMQTLKANPRYRKFDFRGVPTSVSSDESSDITSRTDTTVSSGQSSTTPLYDVIECWMDDPRVIPGKANEEEIFTEHQSFQSGIDAPVEKDQNHFAHVQAHMKFIEELTAQPEEAPSAADPNSPEAQQMAEQEQMKAALAEVIGQHIEEHLRYLERQEQDGIKNGWVRKYPFGRRVTIIGGEVAEDIPNPFRFDWNHLFTKVVNEEVPGHYWGRGDVEILWNNNYTQDTFLSRIADVSLTAGMPKAWFHIDDAQRVKQEWSNDPTEPAFYEKMPPVFRSSDAPPDFLRILEMKKSGAPKHLGVSNVTYGASPTANASGDLVELLIRQNEIQVTGEADVNLLDAVQRLVKARLLVMRQFYTSARYYLIGGKRVPVNVSRLLSYEVIQTESGQTVAPVPIPEISVKPASNYPMEWEREMSFIFRLATTPQADGTPVLPMEALYERLSQRFPEFGVGGRYYQMSQATRIGLQVMRQQAEKAKQDQQDARNMESRLKSKGMEAVLSGGTTVDGDVAA